MKVVGTAGHVDHGKSTLVERLTGSNPDRLPEERRRGMTIELGFAKLTLPNGEAVAVIDVPGHERFVQTMVAGASGIDVTLLVVAADEGVMPQTREHVDVLRLLDVRSGVVAITKSDVADPELIEIVQDDVRRLLSGTSLEKSQLIPVSAITGHGIPELLGALEKAVSGSTGPATKSPPYLPVDRVFTLKGHGTVVTGTQHGGELQSGDKVEIVPGRRQARVRGLQIHGQPVERAGGGSRVALNLTVAKDEVARGDLVAPPGSVAQTRRFDGSIVVLDGGSTALFHGMQVALHVGAAEQTAKVSLVGTEQLLPGENGWARIRLAEPIALVRGMRFVLRLPSPARTVAGGAVLDVSPRLRARDDRLIGRLKALESSDEKTVFQALLPNRRPKTVPELAVRAGITVPQATQIVNRLESEGAARQLGGGFISTEGWIDLRLRLVNALHDFSEKNPIKSGMSKEEARAKLGLESNAWADLVAELVARDDIVDLGVALGLRGQQSGSSARRDEAERLLQVLQDGWFSPPNRNDLLATSHADGSVLDALSAEGTVVKLNEEIYMSSDAYQAMSLAIVQLIQKDGMATVAQIRDDLGITRKYVLAVTEHLDSAHITKRVGDARILGRRAPRCA